MELIPGKHNIIGVDVPLGILQLTEGTGTVFSEKQCVVRNNDSGEILYVQNFNSKHKYIAGTYDIDVLTLPRVHYENYQIKGGVDNKIEIPLPGTLNISSPENKIYSIYTLTDGNLEKIYESTLTGSGASEMVQLLPGDYKIFSRSNLKKASAIKGDQETNIKGVKRVIEILKEKDVNKYKLITTLEGKVD